MGSLPETGIDPQGLTTAEACRRLGELGPNAVVEEAAPGWRIYLAKFLGPIPWLLEVAFVLQLGLGRYVEAAVVGGLLLFNATLGFIQEGRANKALAALKRGLAPTALVCRDGEWLRLPAAELVPGDAIRLALGALVPADARLVSGAVLVDQSMLTGESVPVEANPGDPVYAGSLVRRGGALAEVTATGTRTSFGRTAELVRTAHAASAEQAAVFATTRNLAVVNGTVAVFIIVTAYTMALPPAELAGLALTALLTAIPAALPATFTLSAALAAQALARRGVLLTRLSAAHEAAAMDVLCADKTGTLTRNELRVVTVVAMPGTASDSVVALAAHASSEGDQDPIDAAIRLAARSTGHDSAERLARFVPFDPATKIAEAFVVSGDSKELRIVKGAFEILSRIATAPTAARSQVDDLARQGHRVIAVAAGPAPSLQLIGLIAISDPPRADSAALIHELQDLVVRPLMVTGDSAVTATAIAQQIGIGGQLCTTDHPADDCGVFARVTPEEKFRLVQRLQGNGHVIGMCGDGVNDAPALRQAQVGIAVASATDAAKAAAGLVLTEPGLGGIVSAVREGRAAYQRLLTYTLNMLTKKVEIVLFLAIGLILTGQAILTPALVVLMLLTNDFLAMSLTTDRVRPGPFPSRWRMGRITGAAVVLGACKLAFSVAVLAVGKYWLGLAAGQLQTLAFVTIILGAQALMYVLRERRRLWSSRPSRWIFASSAVDIGLACTLALSGILMEPLPGLVLAGVLAATAVFALILDQIKLTALAVFKFE